MTSRHCAVVMRRSAHPDLAQEWPVEGAALEVADPAMTAVITEDVIKGIVDLVPDDWMSENSRFSTTAENRQAYVEYLTRRLDEPRHFVQEAIRAR